MARKLIVVAVAALVAGATPTLAQDAETGAIWAPWTASVAVAPAAPPARTRTQVVAAQFEPAPSPPAPQPISNLVRFDRFWVVGGFR